jgi:hypothetical protein
VMRRAGVVTIVSTVIVTVALAPAVALAGRGGAGSGTARGGSSVGAHAGGSRFGSGQGTMGRVGAHHGGGHFTGARHFSGGHPGHGRSGHHHHFGRPVHPLTVFASAPFGYYYGSPAYGYAPSYYDPPFYGEPGPAYGVSPASSISLNVPQAPPPTPSVVYFPNGRYELRGDGTTTPYVWVWIPNPPPAPPSAPPPASDPAGPATWHRGEVYRWIDAQGVIHLTNTKAAVPERFRD